MSKSPLGIWCAKASEIKNLAMKVKISSALHLNILKFFMAGKHDDLANLEPMKMARIFFGGGQSCLTDTSLAKIGFA